jgi:hypothetical protein
MKSAKRPDFAAKARLASGSQIRENAGKEWMEYSELNNDVSIYQSNVRAEDGMQQRSRWNVLCEGVIIPLGSVFTVFLAMLCMMLLNK